MMSNYLLIEDDIAETEKHSGLFGLIGEADAGGMELHGFEVDMDSRVLIPELHPSQDHNVVEERRCLTH